MIRRFGAMPTDCPECGWFKFDGVDWGYLSNDAHAVDGACAHTRSCRWCRRCVRMWCRLDAAPLQRVDSPDIEMCPACEYKASEDARAALDVLKMKLGPWRMFSFNSEAILKGDVQR